LLVKVKDQTVREIYAGQLPGILKGVDQQQVRRAMQEAIATAQRHARPESAPPSAGQATPASKPAAAPPGPPARLPAEGPELLGPLPGCWELLWPPEAARGGELLVPPLTRQLFRAAAEQAAESGSLDTPAWLETIGAADRATIV